MAPTICTEKESRVRRIRRRSSSSSVISYVGKITHRRSITMRNASSKLASSRLSDKLSYTESDSSNEESLQSRTDSKETDCSEIYNVSRCNSPGFSETSTNYNCSERLIMSETLDSGYTTPYSRHHDHDSSSSRNIVLSLKENDSFSRTSSSSADFTEVFAKTSISGRKRKNSKGLLEIAIKTIKLIKRNQLLQQKLAQLQVETRAFIESVMANPENRALRDKMQQSTHSV